MHNRIIVAYFSHNNAIVPSVANNNNKHNEQRNKQQAKQTNKERKTKNTRPGRTLLFPLCLSTQHGSWQSADHP